MAICLDGSADDYLDAAMARGLMPTLQKFCVDGARSLARAAMPTFTNVNNSSIVTGTPPSVHGISGNYFFESSTGQEVMMNSSAFLRAETIFPAAARAGRRVAVVTAKEKLRDIFAHNLISQGGIAFSSEKAAHVTAATHGIEQVEKLVGEPAPEIYSAGASIYVLKAGAALLRHKRADFLYLSTTDYIQHKAAPADREALDFYAEVDRQVAQLSALGAVIGITADHGMNPKQKPDGTPNVLFLESLLNDHFKLDFRVILPITDPYVVHHGALGSFAVVHVPPHAPLQAVRDFIFRLQGVTEVLSRDEAVLKMELPADRLGEFVVCSGRDVTLGRTPAHHDFSVLRGGLRSHGGRYEEIVPFIFSAPLTPEYHARLQGDPRNFDLFDFLVNGVSASR